MYSQIRPPKKPFTQTTLTPTPTPTTVTVTVSEVVKMMATRPRIASSVRILTTTSTSARSQTLIFSRAFSSSQTVDLAFDHHEPPKSDRHREDAPIIFMHGLFGSRKNNRTVSR